LRISHKLYNYIDKIPMLKSLVMHITNISLQTLIGFIIEHISNCITIANNEIFNYLYNNINSVYKYYNTNNTWMDILNMKLKFNVYSVDE